MVTFIKRMIAHTFPIKILHFFRNTLKYRNKVIFDSSVIIDKDATFEGMNALYHHTVFAGHLGYGSYIAHECEICAHIGRYTSIAPYVHTTHARHPYQYPYATTSPVFFSLAKQSGDTFSEKQLFEELVYVDKEKKIPIIIGSDCWIGEGAFIVGGIKIGDGAIVLAHAVVTKDVPPYAIVGGVPAKIMKYRYDKQTISFFLEKKWWNKDIEWLKEHYELFSNIDNFKKEL